MKGLKTLIKLSKRELDELRRAMAELETQKDDFFDAIKNLDKEMHTEMESAKTQPQLSQFYGGFANRIRLRQEAFRGEIKKLDTQIEGMREQITEAFGALKRYEIALENSQLREKQAQDRIETIELDDIAGMQHQRKEDQ